MKRWALALEEWHLAPTQSAQCDYGLNPVDRTTCKRGTEFLSVSYRNRNPDRDIQTINDGTAHDDVPDGCSSKTTRGDWAAHLKRTPANYDGNGLFQLVCWQRPPLTATCFVGVDDDTPLFTEPPSPDSPPQPPLLPLPPLPPLCRRRRRHHTAAIKSYPSWSARRRPLNGAPRRGPRLRWSSPPLRTLNSSTRCNRLLCRAERAAAPSWVARCASTQPQRDHTLCLTCRRKVLSSDLV